MIPNHDARMRVVRFLHRRSRTSSHREQEVLDHAIDLTLNEARNAADPGFLARNVVRDAARSLRRSFQRHPTVELSMVEGSLHEPGPSLEDEIVEHLTTNKVLRLIREESPQMGEAFEAYLYDEPVADTAHRMGLSPRQVKHLRQRSFERARALCA